MEQSDKTFGDEYEGLAYTKVDKLELNGDLDPVTLRKFGALGFNVRGSGGHLSFKNLTVRADSGHWLILSFAQGDFESLQKRFNRDACVEIVDPEKLRDAIWQGGTINGRPVAELFEDIQLNKVEYLEREVDFSVSEQRLPVSVFCKRPKYKCDHEYRIALRPKDQRFLDIVNIEISGCEHILREVVRSPNADMTVAPPRQNVDIATDLRAFLVDLDKFERASELVYPLPEMPAYPAHAPESADATRQAYYDAVSQVHEQRRKAFEIELWARALKLYWDVRLQGIREQQDGICTYSSYQLLTLRQLFSKYIARLQEPARDESSEAPVGA